MAPVGAVVGLYVDLVARVAIGDVIETQTGRSYQVLAVRVQLRGKHAGRQHLRVLVIERAHPDATIHLIRWYARGNTARGSGEARR